MELLDTGSGSTLEALMYRGGSWFRRRDLTFPAVLVRHPPGWLLIDTGLGPEIDAQFEEEMPWILKPFTSSVHQLMLYDISLQVVPSHDARAQINLPHLQAAASSN